MSDVKDDHRLQLGSTAIKRFHELIAQLNSYHQRHAAAAYAAYHSAVAAGQQPQMPLPGPYVPVSAEELLLAINNEPEKLRDILEEEATWQEENPEAEFVQPDVGAAPDALEMVRLGNSYNFLPSDMHLQNSDFKGVKKYLLGKKSFSELTPVQQELVKTLPYDDAKFFEVQDEGGNYAFRDDGVRYSALREQLLDRLELKNIMSRETVAELAGKGPMPEDFSYDFIRGKDKVVNIDGNKYQVPSGESTVKQPRPFGAPPEAVEMQPLPEGNRYWFLEDPEEETFMMKKWAREIFGENVDMERHNLVDMPDMDAINQDILLKEANYTGSFQEYLDEINMTAEQFDPIFDVWNKMYDDLLEEEDIIPTGDVPQAPAEIEMVDMFPEEADADVGDIEGKAPEPGDTKGGDSSWRRGDEILDFDPDEMMEAFEILDENGLGLDNAVAVNPEGGVLFDMDAIETLFNENLNLVQGLMVAPGISMIIKLIDMAAPGSARWINTGLTTADLVLSGNPLGVVAVGIMEMVNELNLDAQRLKSDDFAQGKRGAKYGFYKDNAGKWRPAMLNVDVLSTAFGAREQTFSIEYGETLLFKRDHEGQKLFPFFDETQVHEALVRVDDIMMDEDLQYYTKDWLEVHDPLRRYFFFSPEEQQEIFAGET